MYGGRACVYNPACQIAVTAGGAIYVDWQSPSSVGRLQWGLARTLWSLIFATNVKDSGIVAEMYNTYGNDVDPCEALDEMPDAAKKDGDAEKIRKIITTQKGFGCRNKAKRGR